MKLSKTGSGTRAQALKARADHVLGDAREQIVQLEDEAGRQLRNAARRGRGYARENPWMVFGAAAAVAGVIAAWLARRRSHGGD